MKITVDTKHDSKEEIQQAILLLTKLIEAEHEYLTKKSSKEDRVEDTTNVFANMFGAEPQSEDKKEEDETPPRVEMY